ncbi:hypothetical protein [Paenibacillus sp. TH7-28]
MHLVSFARDPEFSGAFDNINNFAKIVDLRRGVKTALIDDLAGEQQLGRFF